MKERDQNGKQNTGGETDRASHEEQFPLRVPGEPLHAELRPYIKEQEGGQAIEIERRWERLPELKQFSTDEWVNQISTLYPDVVTPQAIRQDLLTLDQIGNNAVRERKWNKVGAGGLALMIGSLIATIIPELPVAISIVGCVGGLITTSVGLGEASSVRQTIGQLASQWNNRGENWLHQQRDRLFGSNR